MCILPERVLWDDADMDFTPRAIKGVIGNLDITIVRCIKLRAAETS